MSGSLGNSSIDAIPDELKELRNIVQHSDWLTASLEEDTPDNISPETDQFMEFEGIDDIESLEEAPESILEEGSISILSQHIPPMKFYSRTNRRRRRVKRASFMSHPRIVAFHEQKGSKSPIHISETLVFIHMRIIKIRYYY